MAFLVRNISLGLNDTEASLVGLLAARLHVTPAGIRTYSVVRRSVDARKKDVHFSYQVEVALDEPEQRQRDRLKYLRPNDAVWIEHKALDLVPSGTESTAHRPVVVGFGPGGMFAALRLARRGYRPLVLERGREVRRRHRDIMQKFYREGVFDPTSNLLYGEGGAGTYSDGKLYTRVNDPLCGLVLEELFHHGADPSILIDARPHIGSDRLGTICTRMRERIVGLGGEIRFECTVDDLRVQAGRLTAVHVGGDGAPRGGEWIESDAVLLAVGHSARDTIHLLHERGVRLTPKPFQVGVRIEHPQGMVDEWQYGAAAGHRRLGAAEYHIVAKGAAGDSGDMFSFCMCPGGEILPTNESPNRVVTNGASRANRSSPFGNSGLVITVDPMTLDWVGAPPRPSADDEARLALRALAFQDHWEKLAFEATDRSYRVPAQRAPDFLQERSSTGQLDTSYPLGGAWADVRSLIPREVADALRQALPILDKKFTGFAGGASLITAPETRASAPIRIVRDPITRQAVQTAQLYPIGEGAGYAGGIISAAVDGIKTADAVMARFAPPR